MEYKINLWEIRNEKGMSVRELEVETGISHGRIWNIENNKSRAPDLLELTKLSIALKCKITDLFESEYK